MNTRIHDSVANDKGMCEHDRWVVRSLQLAGPRRIFGIVNRWRAVPGSQVGTLHSVNHFSARRPTGITNIPSMYPHHPLIGTQPATHTCLYAPQQTIYTHFVMWSDMYLIDARTISSANPRRAQSNMCVRRRFVSIAQLRGNSTRHVLPRSCVELSVLPNQNSCSHAPPRRAEGGAATSAFPGGPGSLHC
jgi:hypothetical protein